VKHNNGKKFTKGIFCKNVKGNMTDGTLYPPIGTFLELKTGDSKR